MVKEHALPLVINLLTDIIFIKYRREKMKNKIKLSYLILGMGIGIILNSTLYSIFPNEKYIELSDAIIIDRARELGMVNLKEAINTDSAPNKEEENTGSVDENLDLEEELLEDEIIEEEEYVEVVVSRGERLTDIAQTLWELDLIGDKDEFIMLARNEGVSRNLIAGVYEIKKNTSLSKIIEVLTGQ